MPTVNAANFTGLEQRLPTLASDAFAVVTVPAQDASPASVEAVRILASQGFAGVYVSLSKDYLSVAAALGAAGVDLSRIHFVDAVSRMYGIAPVESPEVTYVDGPLSVDALARGIAESVSGLEQEKRFVLLDSLTTLLLYNSFEATIDFGRALRTMLKKMGAAGIIVVAYRDEVNADLLEKLKNGGGEILAA